ncbi:hypothetical protein JP75_07575 [Devosia riboflavina]|uniref:Uncharacterized protein n=1 Tax=Devosia riboflavina TaxID=46914 RepID=A0A087M3G2_9HYPH|nr:hypothetical protein [Devosia riboflavina]KFL31415.1 hypothetical protein JP75_07575 [Devosia riboflavina]
MADKPFLFSGPMVRALLAGTKTQTRRVGGLGEINKNPGRYRFLGIVSGPGAPHFAFHDQTLNLQVLVKCSIQPGDRLYVREAWKVQRVFDDWAPANSKRGGPVLRQKECALRYLADEPTDLWLGKHRQAMHMPRWASRMTLTVTDVRVERLQDISEADALAEGIAKTDFTDRNEQFGVKVKDDEWCVGSSARTAYSVLWAYVNGEMDATTQDGSWYGNPWVAAYTFTVEHGNIDQLARTA